MAESMVQTRVGHSQLAGRSTSVSKTPLKSIRRCFVQLLKAGLFLEVNKGSLRMLPFVTEIFKNVYSCEDEDEDEDEQTGRKPNY
jgi:hypothetical protein